MGASPLQIIFKVLLPESLPTLVLGVTITAVSLVSYSAMAGAIGGGGLGDLAIRYGYQRFRGDIMLQTVVILVVLVQVIQNIGIRFGPAFGPPSSVVTSMARLRHHVQQNRRECTYSRLNRCVNQEDSRT